MNVFLSLIRREFTLFWSNKVFVVAFLIMPGVLASVIGFVYQRGKATHLTVTIIDKDDSPSSNKLRDMLEMHPTLNVVSTYYEGVSVHQKLLDTRSVAVVVIPYHFEADLLAQRKPEVNCYLNMSNTLSSGAAGAAIGQVAGTMNAGILMSTLQKKGVPDELVTHRYEAMKHTVFIQENPGGNYLYFLWPGMIFSILHQLLLLALAVSFSGEIAAGTFNKEGLLRYNSSPLYLIAVKITPFLLLSFWNMALFYVLSICFRIPFPSHVAVLLCSQLLLVVGTCLLAIAFSLLFTVPLKASQLLMSVATPAFTLSGFTWPSDQAPFLLAAFGKIVPLTPYLKVIRMTLFQHADFFDCMPVLLHQLVLVGVYFLLALYLLNKKIKSVHTSVLIQHGI